MALGRARRSKGGFDYWPGFVDALSTMLLVIIFLLSVFMLAQYFLSREVSGKDVALQRLNRQIEELTSLLAMERAVLRLKLVPQLIRVDGRQIPAFNGHGKLYFAEPVIDGDNLVPVISAASILAKVCRDRLMRRLHRSYPQYGFDQNKGYATAAHLRALAAYGPCAIHRVTFAPVRAVGAEHVR